jgi:hypothetical protein
MGEVVVRVHEGRGYGSAVVRAWTRSPWGHCDLYFPSHDLVLDVRPAVGLRLSHPHDVPRMGSVYARCYEIPNHLIDPAWADICRVQGADYDMRGAIAAGVPWLAREHALAWFCSEACWTFLASCKIVTALPAWRRTPADIYDALQV